jgi:hypothetical protein
MTEYLKRLAELILQNVPRPGFKTGDPIPTERRVLSPPQAIEHLVIELNRLDPRDFEPSMQHEFVRVRANLDHLSSNKPAASDQVAEHVGALTAVLDHFRGSGTGGITRSFPYVADASLLAIIERDYAELTLKLFPSGAWKSTVIMAGSILEALLHDILSNPKRSPHANATVHAQTIKAGPVEKGKWDLVDLIEVAADPSVAVLTRDRADTIDQVLRGYRNFVHPKREIRAKHDCNEAEAGLATYALDGVCNHFERVL